MKSYKVHQIEAVLEEEWVRVPNTCEAIITHETFNNVQARLNAERAELANGVDKEYPELVDFAKYQSIETLICEILTNLGDHIKVYENGNVSVHFKLADEFRKSAEHIEINTTDAAKAKTLLTVCFPNRS